MTNIAVVGASHVGLVTGACLAKLGNRVTCIEQDEVRLQRLLAGQAPLFEPHLELLRWEQVKAKRLSFTSDYASAIPQATLCFIAVDGPPLSNGAADVLACVDSLLPYARRGLVLVIKSTVPVGTGEQIAERMHGKDVEVVLKPAGRPSFGTAVGVAEIPPNLESK